MTTHLVRLAIGEWDKIRRRRIHWLLLGLIVVITQATLWGIYVAYHVSAEPSEDMLSAFTMPSSISFVAAFPELLFPPFMILATTVIGMEYSWGTLRSTIVRGVGRWQLIGGKLIMLMVAGIAAIVVMAVLAAIASLLAGVIPPAEEGSRFAGDAGEWLDTVIALVKLVYIMAPYIALAVFLAVWTQSTAGGIALSMSYYVVELAVPPLIGGLADWLNKVIEVAVLGQNVREFMAAGNGTAADQPDTLRAFFIILAYIVVLTAAAIWLFQRRDISGARGE